MKAKGETSAKRDLSTRTNTQKLRQIQFKHAICIHNQFLVKEVFFHML